MCVFSISHPHKYSRQAIYSMYVNDGGTDNNIVITYIGNTAKCNTSDNENINMLIKQERSRLRSN